MAKEFSMVERNEQVAIAEAIRTELGNRQGRRTDKELPDNDPEVAGKESREIAAKSLPDHGPYVEGLR